VFLPVFFLDGLAGSFFRPLALAYVLAIVASLLVALTVTPALSMMLLTGKESATDSPAVGSPGRPKVARAVVPAALIAAAGYGGWVLVSNNPRLPADLLRAASRKPLEAGFLVLGVLALVWLFVFSRGGESPIVTVLKRGYRAMLPWMVRRPVAAVVVLAVAFVATGVAVAGLGEEFLPNFQENDFLMHWVEKPGTSLEAMTRLTEQASRDLRKVEGVRNFGSHIGRAEVADEVVGPNFTELWISVDPDKNFVQTMARIQTVIDGYPGLVQKDVLTYLKERIKEVLTGAGATVVVRTFGPNMDVLRAKAAEIAAAVKTVPGVTDLKVESQVLVPQLDVRLRPEAAARVGLTAGDVRRAATTLVKGAKVGEVFRDQKVYDVFVWGVEKVRNDVSELDTLPIETPLGTHVPLGDVADVAVVAAPNLIMREGA
ncbi:MAG: efflux RND transporter permease subunit, partial [Planctomycetia bacterium]|nr:efflux RND transporter permease subunit [Planctomycetia bacterium]